MAPRYAPPTRVVTREIPYQTMVQQADPYWARSKYNELEYSFDGRAFYFNPYNSGAYGRRTNTYPVGQQYGGADTLITGNLAPTVGNAVPGLYQGVPDNKGWA